MGTSGRWSVTTANDAPARNKWHLRTAQTTPSISSSMTAYLVSASDRYLLPHCRMCQASPRRCQRTKPRPFSRKASVSRRNSAPGTKEERVCRDRISSLTDSSAAVCMESQTNSLEVFNRPWRGIGGLSHSGGGSHGMRNLQMALVLASSIVQPC